MAKAYQGEEVLSFSSKHENVTGWHEENATCPNMWTYLPTLQVDGWNEKGEKDGMLNEIIC